MTCEAKLIRELRARKWLFATAESCTGGLIAARLTDVPGASEVFLGGIVSYSNAVKRSHLNVTQEVLETSGAVSAACACQMAEGVCTALGADWAVSVTGIAGPGGATPTKPVGLVYIGVAGRGAATQAIEYHFTGTRAEIRQQCVDAALTAALRALTGKPLV